MLNIVSSWNIISELQNPSEWYHLNRKIIFYRSRRSKPGPNRSKWRFIKDFIEISIFCWKITKQLLFFIVWGCFLGPSEGFGRCFGLIRMKKWWKQIPGKHFFRSGDKISPEKKIWKMAGPAAGSRHRARQPGSRHRARVAGDPAPGYGISVSRVH